MTTRPDPDRKIRAFLDAGPTELPDRSLDTVRATIQHTHQRVVIGPWRNPMTGLGRFALAAGAVVVAATVFSLTVLPGLGGTGGLGGPTASPTIEPTPTPVPTLPVQGDLPAGTYQFDAIQGGRAFSVVVPAGWNVSESSFLRKWVDSRIQSNADFVMLSPWVVDNVFGDGCTEATITLVGPTVDDLVTALMAQDERLPAGPVATTVGGYPAQRVTLSLTEALADPACGGLLRNWSGTNGDMASGYLSVTGQVDDVYIIDAGAARPVVIVAAHGSDARRQDLAEMQAILDSVAFLEP